MLFFLKNTLFRLYLYVLSMLAVLNGCDSATILSIEVLPANASTNIGVPVQYQALVLYSDGVKRDVSYHVEWVSSVLSVATISQERGSRGVVTPVAVGKTTISATLRGVTGSAELTVTPAVLASLRITPVEPSVPMGILTQFTAKGLYTDGTQQDLTQNVTWLALPTSVISMGNVEGSKGLATPAGVGSGFVTATLGAISTSTNFTVTSASLSSITVQPNTKTIIFPETQAFIATGTYTDTSSYDITKYVTWSSDTPSVATISNDPGSQGVATSTGAGSAIISATLNSSTGTANLTVDPPSP